MIEKAQLVVMSSGGFAGAHEHMRPQFERASGLTVRTVSGASQGSGPHTIAAQLARGVAADVVILTREGLDELVAGQRIVAGTDVDLARVGLGVAVRAGGARPEVDTVDAFVQVLLSAGRIAIPRHASGSWLRNVLFPRLGIADRINVELTSRGSDAAALVASGAAGATVLPVSEILMAPGVALAGAIAREIQHILMFSAGVVAGTTQPEVGRQLIALLSSPAAAGAIRQSGMEPVWEPVWEPVSR